MTPEQEQMIAALSRLEVPKSRGNFIVGPQLQALAEVVLELVAKERAPRWFLTGDADPFYNQNYYERWPKETRAAWDAQFIAAPEWDAIAPDLLVAADFIEGHDDASLSNGTAENIASILRGLVAFHTGAAPSAPKSEEPDFAEVDEGGGEAETARSSNTGTRARAPVRDDLCEVLKGGFLRMQGREHMADRILDLLQEAYHREHGYRLSFLDRIRVRHL